MYITSTESTPCCKYYQIKLRSRGPGKEPNSEAWGPPQFQEKRSRSERAILGALGEFRGILGAALGIGNSILGIRNSILGMASHDLINTKPTILGATSRSDSRNCREPTRKIFVCPCILGEFFQELGVVPAHQTNNPWNPKIRIKI